MCRAHQRGWFQYCQQSVNQRSSTRPYHHCEKPASGKTSTQPFAAQPKWLEAARQQPHTRA
eukprot:5849773-Karenia_brevis.AAC.1